MKTAVSILVLWAGITLLPCMAGNPKQEKKGSGRTGITMYTDLISGIKTGSPNLGCEYRFHPNWSISMDTGIRMKGWLSKKNEEWSEHDGSFSEDKSATDVLSRPISHLPLPWGYLQVNWWPFPAKWPGFIDGSMNWHGKAAPEFRLGFGWMIHLSKHLICRMEFSASLQDKREKFSNCAAIKLGYKF